MCHGPCFNEMKGIVRSETKGTEVWRSSKRAVK